MIIPPSLNLGDTVAVVAPASPIPPSFIDSCKNAIISLGFFPVFLPSCFLQNGYLAGDDASRACDLNHAFSNPTFKGVFCLRGGYGCTRILPLIDYSIVKKNPKVFVGYSDITALHLAFNQICGLVTYHGPNVLDSARCFNFINPPDNFSSIDSYSIDSLLLNITNTSSPLDILNHNRSPFITLFSGSASGLLTGGNLSLIVSTLGSPFEINCKGKILFIEDVHEPVYRIDRMLTSLALSGKFLDCSAILLGSFSNCPSSNPSNPSNSSLSFNDIVNDIILPFSKPTISRFLAGHSFPSPTLPFGRSALLDTALNKLFIL